LLALIEPTASGAFKAVIVRTEGGRDPLSAPTSKEFPTFVEARDWLEGRAAALGREMRWLSSP
jgi:hypothetical protein